MKNSYNKKYAMIVGINKYKYDNIPNLDYAESDAKGLKEKLINNFKFKPENVLDLYAENATKENINNLLLKIKKNVTEDDSVLIFFACHGHSEDGLRKAIGYIVPYDGDVNNIYSLIEFDEITNSFEVIKCKHIFFIIDSCYSGLAINRSIPGKRFIKDMMKRNVRQILTAGKGNQTVSDGDGPLKDHSIFTGYLLKALDGEAQMDKGIISANSVMAYVYNKVASDTISQQTPHYGTLYGEGDYIFNEYLFDDESNDLSDETFVTIPSTILDFDYESNYKIIDEMKELLSNKKNKIQVFDKVNKELRNIKTQLELENKIESFSINEEMFDKTINKLNIIYRNLFIIVILISYWGDEEYIPILKRIFQILGNISNSYKNDILYYPIRILYYLSFISSIESNKLYFINAIADVKIPKSDLYRNENNLLILEQDEQISRYYSFFNKLNDTDRYYYPISHYIRIHIQPILDDLLFLDNMYDNCFYRAENLISILCAFYRYCSNPNQVWAQGGEFITKHPYSPTYSLDFFNMDYYINQLQLFKTQDEKDKFVKTYIDMINEYKRSHF